MFQFPKLLGIIVSYHENMTGTVSFEGMGWVLATTHSLESSSLSFCPIPFTPQCDLHIRTETLQRKPPLYQDQLQNCTLAWHDLRWWCYLHTTIRSIAQTHQRFASAYEIFGLTISVKETNVSAQGVSHRLKSKSATILSRSSTNSPTSVPASLWTLAFT